MRDFSPWRFVEGDGRDLGGLVVLGCDLCRSFRGYREWLEWVLTWGLGLAQRREVCQ